MNNNHQISQNNFFITTNNNYNKSTSNKILYNSNNLSSNNFMLEQKRSRFMSTDDITSDIEMKPIQSSHPRFFQYIPSPSSSTFSKKMSIDLTDDNFNNKNIQIIGCNCKNSGCLKRYCECFTRMKYCDVNCQCKNCFNTIEHEKERNESIQIYLMKSPISFKKNHLNINNVTCSCKKSNCLKKYCECYQIGIKCNNNCKCVECKNRNKGDKKMFEVNNIENNNNNINNNNNNYKKRERYFSFDEVSYFNRNEKDGLFFNNNNNGNQIISMKTVEIDTNKVIIDNYNFLNNNNINNNINIVNNNNTILNNNDNNNTASAFNTMKVNDN